MERVYDMLVIGGGPAGYTAALYAARAGLNVLVVEKLSAGGQMALTTDIDNYPGFADGIDGFTLGEQMQSQAERFGAQTLLADVHGADLSGDVKQIFTSEGTFLGKTLVIATGANPRKLNIPGEDRKNVHYCAACDGMAYRGKTVVVVGGGNSAVADALTLSRIAKKVYLIHRRDTLRATKVYHDSLKQAENIAFIWNSTVTELSQEGATVRDLQTGRETILQTDGVFISIGRSPATTLFEGQIGLDDGGYIVADESTKTDAPGVFAAGDVRTKTLRQVVTAVADGAAAAHQAEEYLSSK